MKEADIDGNYVIGKINLSSTTATIAADNIKLEGLVTANENFKVLMDGSIEATNGVFKGDISAESFEVSNRRTEFGTGREFLYRIYTYEGDADVMAGVNIGTWGYDSSGTAEDIQKITISPWAGISLLSSQVVDIIAGGGVNVGGMGDGCNFYIDGDLETKGDVIAGGVSLKSLNTNKQNTLHVYTFTAQINIDAYSSVQPNITRTNLNMPSNAVPLFAQAEQYYQAGFYSNIAQNLDIAFSLHNNADTIVQLRMYNNHSSTSPVCYIVRVLAYLP